MKNKDKEASQTLGGHLVGPSSETSPKLDYVSEILGPQATTPRGVLMSLEGPGTLLLGLPYLPQAGLVLRRQALDFHPTP